MVLIVGMVWSKPVFGTNEQADDVPGTNSYGCGLCHVEDFPDPLVGHELDVFGQQASEHLVGDGPPAEQTIDWQALCPLDADGDGYANGVEVDDPDCMYPDVVPNSTSSDPGNASSVPRDGERLDAGGGDASTGDTSDMADAADAADTGSAINPDAGDEGCQGCNSTAETDGIYSIPVLVGLLGILVARGTFRHRNSSGEK
jgi:hypothetical protein